MADDRVFECIDDLTAFVAAGINVTSSGPVLLQWPEEILPPEMIATINDACRDGRTPCTSTASTPASPTTCCRWC